MINKWQSRPCVLAIICVAATALGDSVAIDKILPPIKHVKDNPHIAECIKRVEGALKDPLNDYKTRECTEHDRDITLGPDAARIAELLCHPQSPRKGDPALVDPLIRRLYAVSGIAIKGKYRLQHGFGSSEVMRAYAILRATKPELISKELEERCMKSFRITADDIIEKNPQFFLKDSTGSWVNGDIRIIEALMWAGLLLDEPRYTKAGEQGLEFVSRSFLPDGGFLYVGTVNETFTYHESTIRSLAKFHKTFGSKLAGDLIVKSRFYYPLSIEPPGVAEYSTAACWKPYWNMTTGSGGAEIVAAYTGCPFNKQVAGYWVHNSDLFTAAFYRQDLEPQVMDSYVTYDYNIGGPRGRFGLWSFCGTAREYGSEVRGKGTFAGCMILDPSDTSKDHWSLNAAFHEAGVEIRSAPASEGYARHSHHSSHGGGNYYSISYNDRNGVAVGKDCAALGTVYQLSRYKGRPQPCAARQTWLFTTNRLVGILEITPEQDLEAYSLSATFRLVSGRGHWGTRKILEKQGDVYTYGKLRLRIHDHTFGSPVIRYEDTYNGDERKVGRLSLLDSDGDTNKEAKLNIYRKGVTRYALVEVYPASHDPASEIILHKEDGAIKSFTVEEAGKNVYRVWHNTTDKDTTVSFTSERSSTLLLNGNKHRPEWLGVHEQGAAARHQALSAGSHRISIPAYGVILSASTR